MLSCIFCCSCFLKNNNLCIFIFVRFLYSGLWYIFFGFSSMLRELLKNQFFWFSSFHCFGFIFALTKSFIKVCRVSYLHGNQYQYQLHPFDDLDTNNYTIPGDVFNDSAENSTDFTRASSLDFWLIITPTSTQVLTYNDSKWLIPQYQTVLFLCPLF